MAGTRLGGLVARDTNKTLYGADFYRNIGRAGGKISRGGGFADNPEFAREMGKLGGAASRRGKSA